MGGRSKWLEGGVLRRARQIPSPNQDARPGEATIGLLVIHNISLPPGRFGGQAIENLFTNTLDMEAHASFAILRGLRVSAHFLIRRSGALSQFVPCERRAWHAGVSVWRGRERCNNFSLGVELEGADDIAYTRAQYRQLDRLTRELQARYPITDIVGHSDIAPGRKTDPGPSFDWQTFRRLLQQQP